MTRRQDIGAMFGAAPTETFLGLPKAGDLRTLRPAIAILGAPFATPYPSVGPYCAGAPKAIREAIAGYAANLHHVDFDIGGPREPCMLCTSAVQNCAVPANRKRFSLLVAIRGGARTKG